MIDPFFGAALGALGSLGSTLLGSSAAAKNNKNAFRLAQRQAVFQENLVRHGIKWKVEDAKEAGIHPLYALGASIPSYSPVSANFTTPDYSGLASAGQNIGRAIDTYATSGERSRQRGIAEAYKNLQLENMKLQNARLASEVDYINSNRRLLDQPGHPPGISMKRTSLPGQIVKPVLSEETVVTKKRPYDEPAVNPAYRAVRGPGNTITFTLSDKFKEAVEDSPQEVMAQADLYINQMSGRLRPKEAPPPGTYWKFSPVRGHWYPARNPDYVDTRFMRRSTYVRAARRVGRWLNRPLINRAPLRGRVSGRIGVR